MDLTVRDADGVRFLKEPPGQPLIIGAAGTTALLEACFSEGSERLLLYPENLPAQFFDLISGQAGTIHQKLRNYRIRLAVVRPPTLRLSRRCGGLLVDENRQPFFRLFEARQAAQDWLCSG
jgi:hypothetical protein